MKVLTFSTLYPSSARPIHGIFVETRLRELLKSGEVDARVVAPVPWFPFRHGGFGAYAEHANAPAQEQRNGIEVLHPRYIAIPKVGMTPAPWLLAQAVKPVLAGLLRRFDFDCIDAHYLYPDGVAAVMLGEHFRKPVVITARGSDVTLIPSYRLPRAMIRWAARKAARLITVSRALKDGLVALGVEGDRITVLRNGVDLERFQPLARDAVRAELGLRRTTLLSVGHLIARKAHDLVIRALEALPDTDLLIVGDGPERASLAALAARLGLSARVRFVAARPQDELPRYYSAADVLVLASSREGWANVLLEAMACGTPVVASNVGGAAELVTAPAAGVLFDRHEPAALARAIRHVTAAKTDRSHTRRHAEQFSWSATTRGQLELFGSVLTPGSAPAEILPAQAG
jgi:glycosyltransferase involved in cell wall biosynthesis